jgi:hypothetical protein
MRLAPDPFAFSRCSAVFKTSELARCGVINRLKMCSFYSHVKDALLPIFVVFIVKVLPRSN